MHRFLAMALAVLGPAAAMAVPAYHADVNSPQMERSMDRFHRSNMGIAADVGVNDYNRDLSSEIDVGPTAGVRVELNPIANVGVELGYQGSRNSTADSISGNGEVQTHALGGAIRVNAVPMNRRLPADLTPFVFGGAAYHRVNTDNFVPGIEDGSNIFAIPFGAGVEATIGGGLLVGGRFTYNALINEADNFGGRDTDNWSASVNLGAKFGN